MKARIFVAMHRDENGKRTGAWVASGISFGPGHVVNDATRRALAESFGDEVIELEVDLPDPEVPAEELVGG